MRPKYTLDRLLTCLFISKSTYEYQKDKKEYDKYEWEKFLISHIFAESKQTYGYRRIRLALETQEKINISENTIRKLMKELNIKAVQRKTSHYNSYVKQKTKPEPNLLSRHFSSNNPYEKLVSDVTEFKVAGKKIYLSPLIDLYNGEVLNYSISSSPTVEFVNKMFDGIAEKIPTGIHPIVHTDQGFQYWHRTYKQQLEKIGAIQSMSRKGNCLDNAPAESFFGHLKSEFFYRNSFSRLGDFVNELNKYIYWYNNIRIRSNLDGMSPVEYRKRRQIVNC